MEEESNKVEKVVEVQMGTLRVDEILAHYFSKNIEKSSDSEANESEDKKKSSKKGHKKHKKSKKKKKKRSRRNSEDEEDANEERKDEYRSRKYEHLKPDKYKDNERYYKWDKYDNEDYYKDYHYDDEDHRHQRYYDDQHPKRRKHTSSRKSSLKEKEIIVKEIKDTFKNKAELVEKDFSTKDPSENTVKIEGNIETKDNIETLPNCDKNSNKNELESLKIPENEEQSRIVDEKLRTNENIENSIDLKVNIFNTDTEECSKEPEKIENVFKKVPFEVEKTVNSENEEPISPLLEKESIKCKSKSKIIIKDLKSLEILRKSDEMNENEIINEILEDGEVLDSEDDKMDKDEEEEKEEEIINEEEKTDEKLIEEQLETTISSCEVKEKKKKQHKHKKKKKKQNSRSSSPERNYSRSSRRRSYSRRSRTPNSPTSSHSNYYSRSGGSSRHQARSRSRSPFLSSERQRQRNYVSSVDLRERIDKKRLLEIARKNVLHMIEKGTLPSGLSPAALLAQQQLVTLKAGGKSVQELTEFCKGLACNKDYISDSSDEERKRPLSDEEGDTPFINHPFKLRDPQPPIRMNIPNGVQLPIRSPAEKAVDSVKLRQIFPVSSGNQHRIKELEWVPVEKSSTGGKKSKEAKTSTTTTVAIISSNASKPAVDKALMPPPPVPVTQQQAKITTPPTPLTSTPNTAPISLIIAPQTTTTPPAPQIVQTQAPSTVNSIAQLQMGGDVSSIVAKRLNAVRKLQDNPLDMQALTQMYQAQQQMKEWAQSKLLPGQFGAGPDTRLLTPQELSGPSQVWAKKNQLINAAPLGEGIGMNLLKKMGWNPGEGLGKNKEGSLIPLLLDIKVDKKGLVSSTDTGRNVPKVIPIKVRQDLSGKHPVSALMELCSKRRWGSPDYILLDEGGPAHRKNFLFKVRVKGVEYQPSVSSPNKKQAKALAAQVCLQTLGLIPRNLNSAI